jgi:hypothetical protein
LSYSFEVEEKKKNTKKTIEKNFKKWRKEGTYISLSSFSEAKEEKKHKDKIKM